MPEVFENNPRPRQKITPEDVLDIKTKYYNGMSMKEISELYKGKISHTSIVDILNKKRYAEIEPEVEDHHIKLNKKITVEDIRLIRELKAKGVLHKDIRAALNNKVSMTTISDIVSGKRYSDIK